MNLGRKNLLSALLLLFVAATVAVLGIKEFRHSRAVAAAEAAAPSAPVGAVPAEPVGVAVPAPTGAVDHSSPVITESKTPTPVARTRRDPAAPVAAAALPAKPSTATDGSSTIVVSYFHTTARCASCLRIEDLTAATVTGRFVVPVADKRLVWRVVNVDQPANAHYLKDYQLYTKSVVVSEMRDGKEVRWKNLDKVWTLLGQPEAFQDYVEKEVRSFLEPA